MESSGRSDNLKTIVGMLLKKDKQNRPLALAHGEEDISGPENSTRALPKVTIISAPQSPKDASPTDARIDSEIENVKFINNIFHELITNSIILFFKGFTFNSV